MTIVTNDSSALPLATEGTQEMTASIKADHLACFFKFVTGYLIILPVRFIKSVTVPLQGSRIIHASVPFVHLDILTHAGERISDAILVDHIEARIAIMLQRMFHHIIKLIARMTVLCRSVAYRYAFSWFCHRPDV